jgi:GT2 family glycosyltransferase
MTGKGTGTVDQSLSVSVIVPTAGGKEILAISLDALREQRFADFETIVVDNGSSDGTRLLVRARFPEARLVELPVNVGFGAAANAGAAIARGDYLAFLNNDAEPAAGWLEELVACARRHPRAASVASKILRRSDRSLLDGAGDCLTFSLKAYRRGLGERDERQYETEEEVFSASGTACLWRADAFHALGGFDEAFFAYYEDVDLGFRARIAGYECWYAPRAVALHEGAATTGATWAEFEGFYSFRNRWITIVKNAPTRWLVAHLFDIATAEALSLGRALVLGRGGLALRAYADVIHRRHRLGRERREIQSGARISYRELRRLVHRRAPPLRIALARIDWRRRSTSPAPRTRDDPRVA